MRNWSARYRGKGGLRGCPSFRPPHNRSRLLLYIALNTCRRSSDFPKALTIRDISVITGLSIPATRGVVQRSLQKGRFIGRYEGDDGLVRFVLSTRGWIWLQTWVRGGYVPKPVYSEVMATLRKGFEVWLETRAMLGPRVKDAKVHWKMLREVLRTERQRAEVARHVLGLQREGAARLRRS
jgi:hypothetical protein